MNTDAHKVDEWLENLFAELFVDAGKSPSLWHLIVAAFYIARTLENGKSQTGPSDDIRHLARQAAKDLGEPETMIEAMLEDADANFEQLPGQSLTEASMAQCQAALEALTARIEEIRASA